MTVDAKYWTEATALGAGRNGVTRLADGKLTVTMAPPKEFGGNGAGHNPEELFAMGYSACYLSALRFMAGAEKLGSVPEAAKVSAKVGLGPRADGGFGLVIKLEVSLPGVERSVAEKMVERAHFACPYSNAIKGNVAVETTLL